MPVMEITSINISFNCCRTKQQGILLKLSAHTMYCSEIFHVPCLIAFKHRSKVKPTWLIVELVVSFKYSWLIVFKTQNWVYVAVRLKADAPFCYCQNVSAIKNIGSCENNSWVTIVVGSQHIVIMSGPALIESKDKTLHTSIVMTSHEETFKDWQFNGSRVRELDQSLIAWDIQKACRSKPKFICVDDTWTSHLSVQLQQRCMNLMPN